MATEPDYYDALQVSPKAEPEVIDAAYRRLARRYHPDVNPSAFAQERMRELNRAREVLADPVRRKNYDQRRQRLLAERAMATKPPTIAIPTSQPGSDVPHRGKKSRRFPSAWLVAGGGLTVALAAIAFVMVVADSGGGDRSSEDSGGAATSAPAALATGTEVPPESGTFSDGRWLVGEEMAPGLWRAIRPRECSWQRLAAIEGPADIVIASGSFLTVELLPNDAAFVTEGCGWWTQILTAPSATPTEPFGPGTWLVPDEIAAGTWQNSDSSQGCSWAMLRNLGGEESAVIASGVTQSPGTMELTGNERAFHSWGCGTWTRIGN
jgi:DnaJ domain